MHYTVGLNVAVIDSYNVVIMQRRRGFKKYKEVAISRQTAANFWQPTGAENLLFLLTNSTKMFYLPQILQFWTHVFPQEESFPTASRKFRREEGGGATAPMPPLLCDDATVLMAWLLRQVRRHVIYVALFSLLYNIPRFFEYEKAEICVGYNVSREVYQLSAFGSDTIYRVAYAPIASSVFLSNLRLYETSSPVQRGRSANPADMQRCALSMGRPPKFRSTPGF